MFRFPMVASLLVVGLATGSNAGASDQVHLADLVVRSARWLRKAPGFGELRDTSFAPRLLREVMRLALIRSRGEAEVVGRVLDPVPVVSAETPRELANRLLRRASALPHRERTEFLRMVVRAAPAMAEQQGYDQSVEALLHPGAPSSPFTPSGLAGFGSGRVATEAELEILADMILDTLRSATGQAREEPGDLPLGVVADRLLDG